MDIRIAKAARREFDDAYFRYELDRTGLGREFRGEVTRTFREIAGHPLRWPIILEDVRRCLPKRFPYAIFYQSRKSYVYIIAIMHTSRSPGYWGRRATKK